MRQTDMNYKDLFTPHHIALLVDWFNEKGELCVEIYVPHGGGSGSYFTVKSLAELKKIIAESSSCLEIVITVWKNHTQAEFEAEDYKPLQDELKWIYSHSDEVMYFSVLKNRNWSQPYHDDPDKYRKEIEDWSQ